MDYTVHIMTNHRIISDSYWTNEVREVALKTIVLLHSNIMSNMKAIGPMTSVESHSQSEVGQKNEQMDKLKNDTPHPHTIVESV